MPLSVFTADNCPFSFLDSGASFETPLLLIFNASVNTLIIEKSSHGLSVQHKLSPKWMSMCHSDDDEEPGLSWHPAIPLSQCFPQENHHLGF